MNRAESSAQLQSNLHLRLWGEFALMAMLVMEAFWITDWYGALVHPQASWSTIGIYVGLTLIMTHFLTRGIGRFHIKLAWRRTLLAAWLALVILAGFPLLVYGRETLTIPQMWARLVNSFLEMGSTLTEFWHILFLLLVIYHAIQTAREPLQVYLVQANFQLGLFLLLIYGLLFSWDDPTQAILTTYGFLFFAIAAMSAARISTLSELRGGRLPPLRLPWLLGILAVASIVVGIAVLLGWFTTNIAAEIIAIASSVFFGVLILVGLVIFSPVLLIILSLGPALRGLLETLSRLTFFAELIKLVENTAQNLGIDPAWVQDVARTGKPVVLISILAAVVVFILIGLVWKPWQRRLVEEESATNLPLRAALRFPRLLRRFSGRLSSGGRLLAAARIRWVYAQLLAMCAHLGKPRRASATPLEYLPMIQTLFPGEGATLETLTQAYLKVRYGELPETYEEVQAVLLGWDRLQVQGKQLLKTQKKTKKLTTGQTL